MIGLESLESVEKTQFEVENYKDIEPTENVNAQESRDYLDSLFNDEVPSDETVEKENPRQETVDGKTYYYDDNGELYRVGNELAPNKVYEINGYTYETDDQGRIISAEGTLKIRDPQYERNMENVRDYEGQDYRDGDDRGHLIGHQFGGSDSLENLVPQDAKINRNDYRNFENDLAKEVKNGKEVYVTVEPIYEGDSKRPVAIVVTYTIDGETAVRVFPNGQEE